MKMEQTECFETSAYKIQTPGNYPEESIQHTTHQFSIDVADEVFILSDDSGLVLLNFYI